MYGDGRLICIIAVYIQCNFLSHSIKVQNVVKHWTVVCVYAVKSSSRDTPAGVKNPLI